MESIILIQNNNNVLPFNGVETILVTGPMADAPYDQLGTWAFDGEEQRHRDTSYGATQGL